VHKWDSPARGAKAEIHYAAFITTDMLALREAAMAGVGVVQLPILMVKDQLASGELVRVLDAWEPDGK
jgi:DNA-binding transcriptional LysR family regulator